MNISQREICKGKNSSKFQKHTHTSLAFTTVISIGVEYQVYVHFNVAFQF